MPSDREPPLGGVIHARRRQATAALLVVIAVAGVAWAIYRRRHDFSDSLDRIAFGSFATSLAFYIAAAIASFLSWRSVMAGMAVPLSWREAIRVYFVSQLGKYLPGAVWPVVMQMEAARGRNASRKTVLAANVITIVLGCSVGLLVACALLPFARDNLLRTYWWLLPIAPLFLVLLHPRALPWIVNRILRLLRREPLAAQLSWAVVGAASVWSLVSWLCLGAHAAILAVAVAGNGPSYFLLGTAAMSLAVVLGIVAVPLPAGIGVRDGSLAVILATRLATGQALAVVVASRVMVLIVDVLLAALGGAGYVKRRDQRRGRTM